MEPALLTIDLGTSACKATVYDRGGEARRRASSPLETRYPAPGRAEQDPRDWWTAAVAAAREALGGEAVAAIALTSFRETVALVDGRGEPLAPAIMWLDNRGSAEAAEFAAAFPDAHRVTGHLPTYNLTACKLAWLRRHDPGALSRAQWFLQARDYLYLHLTGIAVTDPSLASRTLLWKRGGGWWPEAIEWARIGPAQLPEVRPSHAAPGRLTKAAADALGIEPGAPVVVGAGDRACEVLGARAVDGRVLVGLGTAVSVSTMARGAWHDRLMLSAAAVEGFDVAEQGIASGSALVSWVAETTDAGDLHVAAAAPGSGGVVLLPFFGGARATRWNPRARGVWAGLDLSTTRGALLRSALEGLALEVRAALRVLREAGLAPAALIPAGGPARGLWPQIIADATATPRVTLRDTEAASMGAFLLAGRALGWWDDPLAAASLNPDVARDAPDAGLGPVYDRLAEKYEALYAALEPWFSQYGGDA